MSTSLVAGSGFVLDEGLFLETRRVKCLGVLGCFCGGADYIEQRVV